MNSGRYYEESLKDDDELNIFDVIFIQRNEERSGLLSTEIKVIVSIVVSKVLY